MEERKKLPRPVFSKNKLINYQPEIAREAFLTAHLEAVRLCWSARDPCFCLIAKLKPARPVGHLIWLPLRRGREEERIVSTYLLRSMSEVDSLRHWYAAEFNSISIDIES